MLCPLKPQSSVTFDAAPPLPKRRTNAWAVAVLAGLWAGLSGAQTAGHAQLNEGARQWVAEQTQMPLSAFQVAPLDPRLNIPACAKKIQFDLPFGNRQSVRARCDQPAWQHFVQVMARPEAVPTPLASTPSTQAPTAPKIQPGLVMELGAAGLELQQFQIYNSPRPGTDAARPAPQRGLVVDALA